MQQEPNKMKPNQKDELEKKTDNEFVRKFAEEKYKYGFTTEVHTDIIERGLNEDVIRLISSKKDEPEWLLEFRLKAYRHWLTLEMPTWAHLRIPEIDYQAISYYADPTKKKEGPKSMEEVDPELIKTFNKLGIPLEEQMALSGMAVDAVMDSVSVKTTFKETLMEKGIIFCSFSEAVREHPDLVKKYMGSVVGYRDNFFAALNSAVFSDGSFVYIPKGVRCPMELSTYFRINARNTGQFERTLIVADDDSYVSYLEGCTAPMRDENQLHAAIVEIIVHDRAEVKYSTVQNWYPGDAEGKGGVYNFVTKRGNCKGVDSKLSWTQVETGSAITWKYPSCILTGDNSTAEFYSVAVTNNYQQADTGTKMIHLGKNTRSTIVSKGISAGHSENSYRGLVRVAEKADNARNYSQCDSLLLGDKCGALTSLSVAVQAGYSVESAVKTCVRDLERLYGKGTDIVEEFRYIESQQHISVPLEELFLDLGERSQIEDIENFASVFYTAKRTGGDMNRVIQKVSRMLGDKIDVKKEIEATLAAKKSEQMIMSLMPVGIILYLQMTSPGFLSVLYGNPFGIAAMSICLVIYAAAYWLGRRIVDIEV